MSINAHLHVNLYAKPASATRIGSSDLGGRPFSTLTLPADAKGQSVATLLYPAAVPHDLVAAVAAAHNAAMAAANSAPGADEPAADEAAKLDAFVAMTEGTEDNPLATMSNADFAKGAEKLMAAIKGPEMAEETTEQLQATAAQMMAEGAKPSFDPVDRAEPDLAALPQPPITDLNPAKEPRPDGWTLGGVVRGQNPGSFHNWTFKSKINGREVKVSHPSEAGAWIELARAIREGRA